MGIGVSMTTPQREEDSLVLERAPTEHSLTSEQAFIHLVKVGSWIITSPRPYHR